MSDGILGGIGKSAGNRPTNPKEVIGPAVDVTKKAAKAQAIKSIKLKVKFKDKKPSGAA